MFRLAKTMELDQLMRDNESEERQQELNSWLQHSNIPTCRSLRELCRAKLYTAVPNRNMIKAVQHLAIPMHEKLYLSLGVESFHN